MQKKTPISLYLADLRRSAGLTQGELDVLAKLPKGTVAHLEAGSKLFTAPRIAKLAGYFKVTDNSFVDAAPFIIPVDRRHNQIVRLIVEGLETLSTLEQSKVLTQVEEMKAASLQSKEQ